jgi:hypothetical protein
MGVTLRSYWMGGTEMMRDEVIQARVMRRGRYVGGFAVVHVHVAPLGIWILEAVAK